MTTTEALSFLGIKTPLALINLRKDGKIKKAYQPGGNKWVYDEQEMAQIKADLKAKRLTLKYY
jgi:hypothetical protein